MKYLSLLLLIVFVSCRPNKPETSWIISGADTIEIIGHYSWRHLGSPCGGWGHNDTITRRFVYKFNNCDTFKIESWYSDSVDIGYGRLDTIIVDSIHGSALQDSILTVDGSNAKYF